MLKELIERDRNHPSVIMWSLSNEAQSDKNSSREYFRFYLSIYFLKYNKFVDH